MKTVIELRRTERQSAYSSYVCVWVGGWVGVWGWKF
jgi:hypothetical protein